MAEEVGAANRTGVTVAGVPGEYQDRTWIRCTATPCTFPLPSPRRSAESLLMTCAMCGTGEYDDGRMPTWVAVLSALVLIVWGSCTPIFLVETMAEMKQPADFPRAMYLANAIMLALYVVAGTFIPSQWGFNINEPVTTPPYMYDGVVDVELPAGLVLGRAAHGAFPHHAPTLRSVYC